jgi:hypothetical protein
MASSDLTYGPAPTPVPFATNRQARHKPLLPALQVVSTATETLIVNPGNPSQPLCVAIPSDTALEQKPFHLLISGFINAAASGMNVSVSAYSGLAIKPENALGAATGTSQAAGKSPFWVDYKLIFDSQSGILTGTLDTSIGTTYTPPSGTTVSLPGFHISNDPVGVFVASVTFLTANPANSINIQNFCITF